MAQTADLTAIVGTIVGLRKRLPIAMLRFAVYTLFILFSYQIIWRGLFSAVGSDRPLPPGRFRVSTNVPSGRIDHLHSEPEITISEPEITSSTTEEQHEEFLRNSTDTVSLADSREDNSTTFAACLLVKDDNHLLSEWIAYHYHVLPLRKLIVAVDPYSKTSPSNILSVWRAKGMDIWEWTNDEFISDKLWYLAESHTNKSIKARERTLVTRQLVFYSLCMKHFKTLGQQWVMITDIDEFLRINYKTAKMWNRSVPPMSQRGAIAETLKELQQLQPHEPATSSSRQGKAPFRYNFSLPCIPIPRNRVGSKESRNAERNKDVDYAHFQASQFQTLRFRHHAVVDEMSGGNYNCKSLIDVSRVTWDDLSTMNGTPHRPIGRLCDKRSCAIKTTEQILILSHYLGSFKQFRFREDLRRNKWYFKVVSKSGQAETDDEIRPWLGGFVAQQGLESAKSLLQDAGKMGLHWPKWRLMAKFALLWPSKSL